MDIAKLASAIDHTNLKPGITPSDVARLCEEAVLHHFAAVCVPPCCVHLAHTFLEETGVQTATVVGFPLGYSVTAAKITETVEALAQGATEIDVVHNISFIKAEDYDRAVGEIRELTDLVHGHGGVIKIILETSLLTDEEIVRCCNLYGALGVDFVKTSTGFSDGGARVETVALMRQNLPETVQIKASGGIRTLSDALSMVQAGASRLGCSAGIAIIGEAADKTSGAQGRL